MVSSPEDVRGELEKLYGKTVIDHALRPRNHGMISDADGFGRVTGPCGDTMEIWLKVRGNTIVAAAFSTDGCLTTLASGSMLTELAIDKSVTGALGISPQDVLDALDGLPADSEHCALLAANTLKEAIKDFLTSKKEPWKRLYRTH
jgi:nitrogen fixation NifU-like protein